MLQVPSADANRDLGGDRPRGARARGALGECRARSAVRFPRGRQGASAAVTELEKEWGDRVAGRLIACDNAWACDAPIVILAVQADAAIPTVQEHAERLPGKIVVSMANNLVKHGNEFNAVLPPHGSVAAEIQALLWRSRVCTAFHLVPAAEFAALDHDMESDVVVLGDDDEAKRSVMEITAQHPEPAPARRRLAAQRGRDGDVRGGAADGEHPAQDARQPAPHALYEHAALRHGATRGRAVRAAADGAHVRVRHHAVRLDAPRARRDVSHLRPPHPPARGARPRGAHGAQHHRRRRLDPAQGARARRARTSSSPKPRWRASTATWPRSRCGRRSRSRAQPSRSPRIIELVGRLLESGHAYLTAGTAYFDVSSFERFGELSHYPEDQMVKLARRAGGNPDDPHRRAPLDFVLWQPSLADEPAWRAPFGVGRPGWHIECSAMAMHEHGPTLDLHGGGTDLIFPHHECEIAQSEAITGEPFVKHWLHSAMVNYEGEKMSKSLGNLVFVSDLLKHADPRAIRLALMRHHYRHGFEWYDTDLEEGSRAAAPVARRGASAPTVPTRAVRGTRARRDRRRPRHAARARSARRPRERDPLAARGDESAPAVLCELGRLLGRRPQPARRRSLTCARPRRRGIRRGPPQARWYPRRVPIASDRDADERADHDHASRRLDPGGRCGNDAAPTSRRRSAPGSPRPRSPPRSTASGSISTARSTTTRRSRSSSRDSDDGREVLRHSTAHVMAEAVTAPVPRRQVRDRSRDRRRLLLRLRAARTADVQRGRPRKIEDEMREIVKADQAFVRDEVSYDDALAVFADQPYKQEIIEKVRAGDADAEDAGEVGWRRRRVAVPQRRRRPTSSSPTCAAARTSRRRGGSARSS